MTPADPYPARSPNTRRSAVKFLFLFSAIWTLVVSIFCIFLAYNVVRALRASGFPTVTGVITASDVSSHMGGKNNSTRMYDATVAYRYTVADTAHTGHRLRYGEMSSSSSSAASAAVARYPVGAEVSVHYNPRDPADSVLETGIDGGVRFMAIFLAPFVIITVGTWVALGLALAGRTGRPRVVESATTRIRLSTFPPVFVGLIAALAVAFPMVFLFAFAFDASASPMQLAAHAGIVLAAGLAAWTWMNYRVASGAYDLIIDPMRKLVTVPRARLKNSRDIPDLDVPFARIRSLDIRDSQTTKVGGEPVRDVFLECGGPSVIGPVKLRGFTAREDAEQFCQWLRPRLGLADPSTQP